MSAYAVSPLTPIYEHLVAATSYWESNCNRTDTVIADREGREVTEEDERMYALARDRLHGAVDAIVAFRPANDMERRRKAELLQHPQVKTSVDADDLIAMLAADAGAGADPMPESVKRAADAALAGELKVRPRSGPQIQPPSDPSFSWGALVERWEAAKARDIETSEQLDQASQAAFEAAPSAPAHALYYDHAGRAVGVMPMETARRLQGFDPTIRDSVWADVAAYWKGLEQAESDAGVPALKDAALEAEKGVRQATRELLNQWAPGVDGALAKLAAIVYGRSGLDLGDPDGFNHFMADSTREEVDAGLASIYLDLLALAGGQTPQVDVESVGAE